MPKEIAFDDFLISRVALSAWNDLLKKEVQKLKGHNLRQRARAPEINIGAQTNEDGTLTLYFRVPNTIDVSVQIAQDHWRPKI